MFREIGAADRSKHSMLRGSRGVLEDATFEAAVEEAGARLRRLIESKGVGVIAGIASPHAMNEDLFSFRRLFDALGADCSYWGVPISADTVCLMLRKAGNSFIGYYHLSEPGETEMPTHMGWAEVGRCYKVGTTPERVGLAVSNGGPGAAELSADFEIVTLVERK